MTGDPDRTSLSRRAALGATLAGAAGATLARPALAAPASEAIEWRMVTSWPKNLPGPGMTAERLAKRIADLSGGRLTIKVYAAGELVPALEVFDAVTNGAAEMAHTASLFWQGKMPAAALFTAGPFGLTPLEHIAWINHGGGQAVWEKLYQRFGVRPLMAGNTGFQMGGWFRKEITSLDDLKGLKIRMPGLGGEVMRRLGATPVSLPPGEIFTALESGVIDGTEFLGPWSDAALGFYKVAKYYYAPGFHEPNGTGEALLSKKAFDALPADLQAVVEHAAAAENIFALTESEWHNGAALTRLRKEHGVELRYYPDTLLSAAATASEDVLDMVASHDAVSAEVVASFRKARATQATWSRVSQARFLAARDAAS
ncbi:TRAP-type mannitol/chloroaromatic compound transport system substrate-binding protein [Rhodobium orientis]|uniref:ABC transporter substrate-binding protein n=1 Tax=Rhodobium orientis TaxID=34017 RepID=A0A327JFM0_9HYPH|nr:TRAP transporter substrate-binding protein [Rhodobium orientis]MBB4303097.1 TRAP-type mannitol/chloroaromatic compound transport system substrate-binding protein [Rhodobium orientis]MBK5948272.1 ABC transporter substrate-binding protein [Rhodobium orientis]RAI24915.1 ABC transporter substrate-binding protein [Rhodobium orientis]